MQSESKHVYGEHSFHTSEPLSHACGSNDSSSLRRQMCVSIITAELSRAAWTLTRRHLGSDLFSFAFKISNPTRNWGMRSHIPHFNNESPDYAARPHDPQQIKVENMFWMLTFVFSRHFLRVRSVLLLWEVQLGSEAIKVAFRADHSVRHFMVYHYPKKSFLGKIWCYGIRWVSILTKTHRRISR